MSGWDVKAKFQPYLLRKMSLKIDINRVEELLVKPTDYQIDSDTRNEANELSSEYSSTILQLLVATLMRGTNVVVIQKFNFENRGMWRTGICDSHRVSGFGHKERKWQCFCYRRLSYDWHHRLKNWWGDGGNQATCYTEKVDEFRVEPILSTEIGKFGPSFWSKELGQWFPIKFSS